METPVPSQNAEETLGSEALRGAPNSIMTHSAARYHIYSAHDEWVPPYQHATKDRELLLDLT